MRDRLVRLAGSALVLLGVLLVWEAGVRLAHVPPYLLPPPSRVLATFFGELPLLLGHAATTVTEVALGLSLGLSAGVILAALLYHFPVLERAFSPFLIGSQVVPIFAVAPLLVLWLGYGLWPKVIVASLIVFFPITVNVLDGLRSLGGDVVDLLASLGAKRRQIFWLARAPASLPFLFSGLKVGTTLSLVGATVGEWVGAKRGLGFLMLQANARMRVDLVFAAILTLTLLGLLLLGGLRIIERRLLRWQRLGRGGGER